MAAATALLSSTRRSASKEFHFETNPAARRRHQTRLLRKIRALCHEYCARVGQQAVFVAALPAEQDDSQTEAFKIIGSSPLDTVVNFLLFFRASSVIREIPNCPCSFADKKQQATPDESSQCQTD